MEEIVQALNPQNTPHNELLFTWRLMRVMEPYSTPTFKVILTLPWRHNDRGGVSNHQLHDFLLKRFSGSDQRKHQSSASLAFVWGIHRWLVNSPHKWLVTREMFPFDGVVMECFIGRVIKGPHSVYSLEWITDVSMVNRVLRQLSMHTFIICPLIT